MINSSLQKGLVGHWTPSSSRPGTTNKIVAEGPGISDWSAWNHWSGSYWSESNQYSDPAMGQVYEGNPADAESTNYIFSYYPWDLKPDTKYTFSCYMSASTPTNTGSMDFYIRYNSSSATKTYDLTPGEWTYVEYEYTSPSTLDLGGRSAYGGGLRPGFPSGTFKVFVAKPQFEEKKHATPFVNGSRSGTFNDSSGHDNHGTASASRSPVVSTTSPINDKSFLFDGIDDTINLPNLGFSGDVPITINVWHNITSGSSNNLFGFGNSGTSNSCCSIRTNGDGGYKFYFWGNDLNASVSAYYGTWAMVTAVYDPTINSRTIYHNGVKVASDSPTAPAFDDQQYTIGGFNDEFASGNISSVRVYNRPLNDIEIARLYQMRSPRHAYF